MLDKVFWVLLVGLLPFCSEFLADTDIEYPTLNPNSSYCFEYTWYGPEYDNNSRTNDTCDDFKDNTRAGDSIPCAPPLVISEDGTLPNVGWLWNNHRASVLCRKAENQACVTYTFWENGLIQNQTHMCARVRTKQAAAIPQDFFRQKYDGYEIELYVCKGGIGLSQMPCNSPAVRCSPFGAATVLVFIGFLISWLQ
ncbi:hypothetical protein HUJ04_011495 [Dendroctonus ponderosae]|nr:hypothetical protein HUJ04_011495 [Dendroctonus ponderosae]